MSSDEANGIQNKTKKPVLHAAVAAIKNMNEHLYGLKSGWIAGGRKQQGPQQGQENPELRIVGDW